MKEFLAMGGYGAFVWSSYAVFFVVMAIDYFTARLSYRRALFDLRGRVRRQQKREGAST